MDFRLKYIEKKERGGGVRGRLLILITTWSTWNPKYLRRGRNTSVSQNEDLTSKQPIQVSVHPILGIDFNCANIVRILHPCTLPVRSTATGQDPRERKEEEEGGGSVCTLHCASGELLELPRAKA